MPIALLFIGEKILLASKKLLKLKYLSFGDLPTCGFLWLPTLLRRILNELEMQFGNTANNIDQLVWKRKRNTGNLNDLMLFVVASGFQEKQRQALFS